MENKEEMTLNELEHITGGKIQRTMILECPVCHRHFQADLGLCIVYCPKGHKMELNG